MKTICRSKLQEYSEKELLERLNKKYDDALKRIEMQEKGQLRGWWRLAKQDAEAYRASVERQRQHYKGVIKEAKREM